MTPDEFIEMMVGLERDLRQMAEAFHDTEALFTQRADALLAKIVDAQDKR